LVPTLCNMIQQVSFQNWKALIVCLSTGAICITRLWQQWCIWCGLFLERLAARSSSIGGISSLCCRSSV
jgi:hypothetical protein